MELAKKKQKGNLGKYTIYFVLLGMIVVLSVLSSDFLQPTNIINVLMLESPRAILAIGMGLVMISKGIDLSIGGTTAIASVISCSLVQNADYISRILPTNIMTPVWVAILAGLGTGLIVGLLNGYLIAYVKLPPFIATLGVYTITVGVAYTYTNTAPVTSIADGYKILSQYRIGGVFPIIVAYVVVLYIFFWILLNQTPFGKSIYAIGGSENAARVAGINIERTKMQLYVINALLAAAAGMLLAGRSGSGNAILGKGYELDAISAAAIGGVSMNGGVGTLGGIMVGVLILGVLNNGMLLLGFSTYLQEIVKGVIIIVAVTIDLRRSMRKGK